MIRVAQGDLTAQLNQAQSKLADALSDLAISQRERDLLHQRLREQDRQRAEDQNRIDAMMDVARPHLAKNKSSEQQGAIMAEALMELLHLALLRIPAASPAEDRLKNRLSDLVDHLLSQCERLNDEALVGERLREEVSATPKVAVATPDVAPSPMKA